MIIGCGLCSIAYKSDILFNTNQTAIKFVIEKELAPMVTTSPPFSFPKLARVPPHKSPMAIRSSCHPTPSLAIPSFGTRKATATVRFSTAVHSSREHLPNSTRSIKTVSAFHVAYECSLLTTAPIASEQACTWNWMNLSCQFRCDLFRCLRTRCEGWCATEMTGERWSARGTTKGPGLGCGCRRRPAFHGSAKPFLTSRFTRSLFVCRTDQDQKIQNAWTQSLPFLLLSNCGAGQWESASLISSSCRRFESWKTRMLWNDKLMEPPRRKR